MFRTLLAGGVIAFSAPAHAADIHWIAFVDVVEVRYGDEGALLPSVHHGTRQLHIRGADLAHLRANALGIPPIPSVLVARAEDGVLKIAFPPIYAASFGISMNFDTPLEADFSNLYRAKFVSGGYSSGGCGRGTPTNCSNWRGTMTGVWLPEPTTWTLMIGGFALAGATMRRRTPTVRSPEAPRSPDTAHRRICRSW